MTAASVLDVLIARREHGSRPGARRDDFRLALAIEGGGNRAAYSAGMAIALAEADLIDCLDDVFGTSGGALNGAWLLTGEGERWLPSWAWPEVAAAGVTDPRRLLRGGPLVDLRRLVEHVYEQVTPMDFDAILTNPVRFHPVATDARTGHATDLAPLIEDRSSLQAALRASACLPLLGGRPVHLGGRAWLDGGLAEPVPYRQALASGATHVLVLRTRREDQTVAPSRLERLALAPYFLAHGRGAGRSHASRHRGYAADDRRLATGAPTLAQVRPPAGAPSVARLSRDLTAISEAIELGRRSMRSFLAGTPAQRP
ncbi:patatin-like phospholipase family protein [Nocardioides limicola]|uniref:patatin-like phospholipase family protein n=1 Tax=Nocardioides limicola TaxID=2803368 RepID=UPI00193C779C|nr:patatin-like phospholipase family protein [Nocardioides sp. DJM-14]